MRHATLDTFDLGPAAIRRAAIVDVKRRLLAIATSLEPAAADQRVLQALASELETVIHRVRWLTDISEMDVEAKDLRPYRHPTLEATIES